MKASAILLITAFTFWVSACTNQVSEKTSPTPPSNHNSFDEIIADTIIYEVKIHNTDSLDQWAAERLKGVNADEFIESVFNKIYKKEITPYEYFSKTPMSVAEIKKLEESKQFSRDQIGQLQFAETWTYDPTTLQIHKSIHSVLFAYEVYNEEGLLRGYKAAFYIEMNP